MKVPTAEEYFDTIQDMHDEMVYAFRKARDEIPEFVHACYKWIEHHNMLPAVSQLDLSSVMFH